MPKTMLVALNFHDDPAMCRWEEINMIIKHFTGGQPTTSNEVVKKPEPLKLNLQFFADGGDDGGGDGGDGGDDGGAGDGEDDEPLTFAELIKQNPEYRQAHNERVEKAVKRRLKNANPDKKPGDKKPDGDDGDEGGQVPNPEFETMRTKAEKLEARTKSLEVAAFAAAQDGFTKDHVKLIQRLSAGRLKDLDLDDDGNLDGDEVADLVEAIVDEFPTLFAVADANQEQQAGGTKKRRSPGSTQQTNDPKKDKDKGVDAMKERFERLNKKGRIK